MFPPFSEKQALDDCIKMIKEIKEGFLTIPHEGQISPERTDIPIMLGSLICTDVSGREIKIRAVSGNSRYLKPSIAEENVIYAPSLVSAKQIQEALADNDDEVHSLTAEINQLISENDEKNKPTIKVLTKKRTELTTQSLLKFHALYSFNTFTNKKMSLREICDKKKIGLPPTGVGECCAPKLLDYAAKNNLHPVSLAEVLFDPKKKETDEKPISTPPCDSRCSIILPDMLGLEILYRDESIIVINKESGILSIPGKIEKDSVTTRLKNLFPDCIEQPAVHRLDMETSGLLVLAFTKEAHRNLSMQFQEGLVEKEYEALLDGILPKKGINKTGQMELYFRVDLDNRPHQMWDEVYGKKAITQWEILDVESYTAPDQSRRFATRVKFIPHTGRTHQLRLASADVHGFGVPIIGDTLYGKCDPGERLLLHSTKLVFTHPDTNEKMSFYSETPF